ncbi:MAG: hypothetical protein U0W40_07695 [Acidimicrobiia bacterium]
MTSATTDTLAVDELRPGYRYWAKRFMCATWRACPALAELTALHEAHGHLDVVAEAALERQCTTESPGGTGGKSALTRSGAVWCGTERDEGSRAVDQCISAANAALAAFAARSSCSVAMRRARR